MDILRKARKLEAGIARVLDNATRRTGNPAALEPLEIVHAVVDAAVAEVQPAGRGKHVFPYNRVKVSILAPLRSARVRLEAVFEHEPSLADRLAERLRSAGCDVADLTVKVVYASAVQSTWTNPQWDVEFSRQAAPATPEVPAPVIVAAPQPALELQIVVGAGEPQAASFAQERIDLGRCAEVRDGRNHLIRTNHVAFSDELAKVNQSVSRRHAHIAFTASSGEYRIHDDRSAHGTRVLRNGKTIAVPSGARGIRLRSGDEVVLGEARVRVRIADPDAVE